MPMTHTYGISSSACLSPGMAYLKKSSEDSLMIYKLKASASIAPLIQVASSYRMWAFDDLFNAIME